MKCLYCLLGFLLLAARLPRDAAKRFHDVLSNERTSGFAREHNRLSGWSSDENEWNEKLYPVWKRGDPRWNDSWKGGHVKAVLTSDSPALVGSNITFVVNLVLPRCQKEDDSGNIVYEKNCRNGTGPSSDPYVYNWSAWAEDLDPGNITGQSYDVFPDGRPFPHHHRRRGWNFVYVFHTLGQYYQKLGRCSASVSVNTANMTLGPQLMEVTVYRRKGRTYVPIAKVKDVYVVTDQIPVSVTMSQKNDRNASDETFLRDIPIIFDVFLHDPSHFLNESAINYKWNFGDNTGLFVSIHHTLNHTYVLNGTFSLNLTVQAVVPGPCPSPTPRPPKPTPSLSPAGDRPLLSAGTPGEHCQIYRDGYFTARLTIVVDFTVTLCEACVGNVDEQGHHAQLCVSGTARQCPTQKTDGILEVDIIQATEVAVPVPQPGGSWMDFVVTCRGTIPTEVCTIMADPTCQVAQNTVCSPTDVGDTCLLTVRRAFTGSGTYCLNLTLGDDASLALTSTLVAVPGRDPGPSTSKANGALVSVGCLAVIVTLIALLVYKKRKEYKPIENSTGIKGNGLNIFLEQTKVKFFPGSQERDPLLKNQPGVL